MFSMKKKTLLLLGEYMYLCNLFISSQSKPLIGHVRYAVNGEFPFIVSIAKKHIDEKYYHLCTGSLISNRDVLTAAHCVKNEIYDRIRVIVGSAYLLEGQQYGVSSWKIFTQWAIENHVKMRYSQNDIAMIRLEKNVSGIEPGVISGMRNNQLVDCTISIAGWGLKENDVPTMTLQTGNLTVIDIKECRSRVSRALGKRKYIPDSYFCSVTNPYVLVHQGDSGGPVLYSNEIVGVTRASCPFGDRAYHPEKVNIHTGIFLYRNFIFDYIAN